MIVLEIWIVFDILYLKFSDFLWKNNNKMFYSFFRRAGSDGQCIYAVSDMEGFWVGVASAHPCGRLFGRGLVSKNS